MSDPLATLDSAKRACTGVGLSLTTHPDLTPTCTSETEFQALVSSYYKLFREELADDIAFLRTGQQANGLRRFDDTINKLRTAAQHTDNPAATHFYIQWVKSVKGWSGAADTLATELRRALASLAQLGMRAMRNPATSAGWQAHVAVDTATVFLSVEGDLALSFTPANRARMVRHVDNRLRTQRPGGDRKAVVQDYCVQEIISDRRPLPVPYYDVLDRLKLIGDPGAQGALVAAYAVAGIAPDLTGESFLARVEQTWRAAASYGASV